MCWVSQISLSLLQFSCLGHSHSPLQVQLSNQTNDVEAVTFEQSGLKIYKYLLEC